MKLLNNLSTYFVFIICYGAAIHIVINGIINGIIRKKFKPNSSVKKYKTGKKALYFGILNVVIGVIFLILLTYHLIKTK
jgi:hypothetical protein